MSRTPLYPNQIVPLFLTTVVCASGIGTLFLEILLLNHTAVTREPINLVLRTPDILVGITIYLKTSIDFAMFIGRLMTKFPGWKNRIMIEIGTALGNIVGTLAILLIWDFFREVKPLMAVMIVIAALVLLRMAEEGLEHVKDAKGNYLIPFAQLAGHYEHILHRINMSIAPILNRLIPELHVSEKTKKGFRALFLLAFSIPFLLGLDDFAGYIPLFNIVNIFGFASGVFIGHMVLNIALFLSPRMTIRIVKHPLISFVGSIAFVGLAIWGLVEAATLIGI
ncbi:hypothetical protein C5B42_05275 [Candidatus Cerribacteria bacterium 'Amazon FNV 2010 28 9']|uniref:Uncharacterized protein n=1 Tax=Candidatus Cerribacteria bacterium 'Amazon FNV 2010 28 9' TaxID=2081795 RepID=A0A317JNX9_9BACT|nr:MAG: hypothetical protein C5B42_05275 [Candidatus Cerribacteria bacterium 'Amazon FNV 2010 28 9']